MLPLLTIEYFLITCLLLEILNKIMLNEAKVCTE